MNIPSNYFIIVDIIIVAIFVVCFIISYKNGIIYEFLSLFMIVISLFLGYFLAPIFAKRSYLVTPSFNNSPMLNTNAIYFGINTIVWFIIISIFFILLFLLIKPIFKSLTKLPVVGWINKVFGLIFGFIKGILICSLLSCILSTSLFVNSSDIKNGTIVKFVDVFSSQIIKIVVNNINYKAIDENISDFDINVTRQIFEDWLIKQGFINERL